MTYPTSLLLIYTTLLLLYPNISISSNTLLPNQSLTDNQTLISQGKVFELGFFSPGNSKNRYLGIWYKKISPLTVVWIANRNTPITDSSGVLNLDENGNLLLVNGSSKVVWTSNQTKQENPFAEKTILKLLDSGNFVVMRESGAEDDEESYRWQSFNCATDTLLPGMKLGWDSKTGLNNSIVSWKSADDPSAGDYSFVMDPNVHIAPEIHLFQKQTEIYRSGPWNGYQFSGVPEMKSEDGFVFKFSLSATRKVYSFITNESIVSRLIVNGAGKVQRYLWLGGDHGWISYWDAPKDTCDRYKVCGAYGICDSNDLAGCYCVKGFEPTNKREWELRDGSSGCVRKKKFVCGKNDGFLKLKAMKLPACSKTYYNDNMDLKECREMCKRNCSCTAYANSHVTSSGGGGGCIFWIGDLVDLRVYANGGQDLYVRVEASELDNNNKPVAIIIAVSVIALALLLGLTGCYMWRRKLKRDAKKSVNRMKSQEFPLFDMFLSDARDITAEYHNDDLELPLIEFDIIAATTENFSDTNLLGHGGFGSVYKGTLEDGQQIAVKRLSKSSGQGVEEFKNEVMLIAKLQHRNLVRLLGCCIDGEERMLIYEYMPNKSLDSFLFDKSKSLFLDWGKRFNIIMGVARGLLYLHQDSRFRIIHRDLKASNILLDDEMNPKISDFGMARIFGGDQTEANTRRVVGTYGYMAPEYAMDGLFSVKSDVFSYGVLMLEIISGQRNRGFYSAVNEVNLLGHAWKLWEDGKGLQLVDESIGDKCSTYEVLKCIQVGLLCVQEHAEDRPTISSIVLMLGSESATLAQPKQPGFSLGRTPKKSYSSSNDQESCSVNQVTVTMLDAR